MIFNTINGKIYIGKSQTLSRWKRHLNVAKGGKSIYKSEYSIVHKAINKYGAESFEFRIIQFINSSDQLSNAEKYWIDFYQTNLNRYPNEYGYNLTDHKLLCLLP